VYARLLEFAVKIPLTVLALSIVTLVAIVFTYSRFGAGIEFFVETEPMQTQIQIFARGNFSPPPRI